METKTKVTTVTVLIFLTGLSTVFYLQEGESACFDLNQSDSIFIENIGQDIYILHDGEEYYVNTTQFINEVRLKRSILERESFGNQIEVKYNRLLMIYNGTHEFEFEMDIQKEGEESLRFTNNYEDMIAICIGKRDE